MDIEKDDAKKEVIPVVDVDVVKENQAEQVSDDKAEDGLSKDVVRKISNAAEKKDEIYSSVVDVVKDNQDEKTRDGQKAEDGPSKVAGIEKDGNIEDYVAEKKNEMFFSDVDAVKENQDENKSDD